ncbi:MAG TPA: homoprotocatechuate degradation operon regulator HpaR [Gammaproteobacteria bacterium]|nr:homoprotocatechuate degradation operon regulator HpaR [Gammaproteobacteria bacterium]
MLLRARETVMQRFRPILHTRGITEQQWRTLRALDDFGELSAARLAAECSILAPSMTRILRKLSEQGFVTVTKSSRDQRELEVGISPKGQQLVNEVRPQIQKQYALLREQLSSERLVALYRELNHLIDLGARPNGE